MEHALLEMKGISKSFPGIKALNSVDFKARAGEVHALIGENGAGKSTLVKILTGIHNPDEGSVFIKGKEVTIRSPLESQALGIAAIHQEATMFPELTVTENIFMGHHNKKSFLNIVDWKGMRDQTEELLKKLEVDIDPDIKLKSLSIAQRHLIEIVKALSFNAQIVIMDEPTSALSFKEVEELYNIVRQLKKEGKAIIFISHKFDEIFNIADYYTVLRDGNYIGEGKVEDTKIDDIVEMMVGRSLSQMYPKVNVEIGKPILSVKNLSSEGIFKDISFDLHEGEILGFFGLVGAGRSEFSRALFGIDPLTNGEVYLYGKKIQIQNPNDAMKHGFAYVPEDRQGQGVILEMSIRENTTLPIIEHLSQYSFTNKHKETEVANKYAKLLEVKASSWEQIVNALSGGNQQKVVLAKWLATEPKVLILDEPTRGIDVATKAAVHEFMGELVKQGIGIILISSELLEVLGMADNIVIMHEGLITARFTRDEATADKAILAATGETES